MDLKIVFLLVAGIVLSIRTEVNKENVDDFAAIAFRKLPIERNRLYQFVTFPDTVDKVSWRFLPVSISWCICLSSLRTFCRHFDSHLQFTQTSQMWGGGGM